MLWNLSPLQSCHRPSQWPQWPVWPLDYICSRVLSFDCHRAIRKPKARLYLDNKIPNFYRFLLTLGAGFWEFVEQTWLPREGASVWSPFASIHPVSIRKVKGQFFQAQQTIFANKHWSCILIKRSWLTSNKQKVNCKWFETLNWLNQLFQHLFKLFRVARVPVRTSGPRKTRCDLWNYWIIQLARPIIEQT